MATRASFFLPLCLSSLVLSELAAQDPPAVPFSYFEDAFDHSNAGTYSYHFPSATWNWIQQNHPKGQGPAKFNSLHLALIPTPVVKNGVNLQGKVFAMSYGMWDGNNWSLNKTLWSIIDPEGSNKLWWNFQLDHPSSDPPGDFACSAHSWDKGGRLFFFGGTRRYDPIVGSKLAYVWDPNQSLGNSMWRTSPPSPMHYERWYPSVTRVRDAEDKVKFIVTGGDAAGAGNTYEAYDPVAKVWDTHGTNQNRIYPGPTNSLLTAYPRQHLLSNGVLFIAPFHRQSVAIRHKKNPPAPWQTRGDTGAYNHYPTSVLMPNTTPANEDTVLRMGGAYINSSPPPTYFSQRLTQKCKASASTTGCWPTGHTWSGQGSCAAINQMIEKRADCDAVILPDGSVFVVGGEDNTPGGKGFLLSAELFKGGVWSPDAFHESPHGWHGTALLLPSAKVLVAGGNWRTRDYEIYVPLYLASGMPRPAITTAPTEIKYGFEYDVFYNLDPSAAVTKVVLMRPGSVTHAFCYDQRYVQLELSDLPPVEGSIRFKAPWSYPGKANPPAGAVRAPLGYYMLFLVTGDGVPSVAHWVKLVP